MRGVALWALGAAAAFAATAAAFLLLAEVGGGSATGGPAPRGELLEEPPAGPALALDLPEDRLQGLQRATGQKISVDVRNAGSEELPSVDLSLGVATEDTSRSRTVYRKTVEDLAPGGAASVEFEVDLSPLPDGGEEDPESGPREVLEARATASGGVWDVKTAVLPP